MGFRLKSNLGPADDPTLFSPIGVAILQTNKRSIKSNTEVPSIAGRLRATQLQHITGMCS